jgi:hypothetical protein
LVELGQYFTSSLGAKVRMGLYRDNGGTPGQLIAVSSDIVPTVGRAAFFPGFSDVLLVPGDYWIASSANDTIDTSVGTNGNSLYGFGSVSTAPGSNFPGVNIRSSTTKYNYFISVEPNPL